MTAILRALLVAIAVAIPAAWASAQDLPALHDVTGVAPDDVLNVRTAPDASAAAIGFLAPDASMVEVTELAPDGAWGKINLSERSGWVAMRFLDRRAEDMAVDDTPPDLRCSGTEPFWALRLGADQTIMAVAGEVTQEMPAAERIASSNQTGRFAAVTGDDAAELSGTIAALPCTDGMSDLSFGLEAQIILQDDAG
ncbi:hypothetical protein LCGC14_2515220, partial [marine sediment metagenome]